MELNQVKNLADAIIQNVKKVIIGKDEVIESIVVAMLAEGHILIEDVPGSGKTMLAKALAKSISGEFRRVQLTPDLMPADITGINYFNVKTSEFEFVRGPVFSNILIADEINRATPKTQSGLLESMEERQVTIDGTTYPLDKMFMVIATQNPIDTQGVFPLPEAQIDRFLMKLDMSYPTHKDTVDVLRTHVNGGVLEQVVSVVTIDEVADAIETVKNVKVSDDLIDYVVHIIEKTRNKDGVLLGISNRGGLALLKASKAVAAMEGREYVLPDDIKKVASDILAHRLVLKTSLQMKQDADKKIIEDILNELPVPTEPQIEQID